MKASLWSALLCIFVAASTLGAASREAAWAKVHEAQAQRLPKTAIEQIEPILAGALQDRAYPEAIRALTTKIALESEISGDDTGERIIRLQAEISRAPEPMKPAMEAILAHWYWQYFQQNRWRFLQRTQTTQTPGDDFKTWDLARILAEIDRHFTAALAHDATLKKIPVRDYDALLEKGDAPDRYRPTLFDFLVHEALAFYQTGEQAAVLNEDRFELSADSPIFADASAFLNWQPKAPEPTSPAPKAIRLYQQLLQFHQRDKDKSAFYDADLARLNYGRNTAVGETKDARFVAALRRFIADTTKHEISARALAQLATQLHHAGDSVQARDLALRGQRAFPDSIGALECFNLVQQIEAKSARLETETVWNAPWPTINLTYRNLTKVYFRAVRVDFESVVEDRNFDLNYLNKETFDRLSHQLPALTWSADLPATADYRERTETLPAPATLKPGFYFITASYQPAFSVDDNQITTATVWVSDLALVVQQSARTGGLVLAANSGEPVVGATVRTWRRDANRIFQAGEVTVTDAEGRFTLPDSTVRSEMILLAEHAGHAVSNLGTIWPGYAQPRAKAVEQTFFFTDRALYRPGQVIRFKGICIRYDQTKANYTVLPDKTVDVVFRDPSGKEISRAALRTNDYGSFAGEFIAPRDRLTGGVRIEVVNGGPSGAAYVNVEEYKRPKFQVELAAPTEAAKLDQPVALTGKATAYTGAAIGGAKVSWRVERQVEFPRWCWWGRPPASQAIAHGTALTHADGTFEIEFNALPDRSVPAKNEPVFVYAIHADVTDTTGETRSQDRTLRAGYTALQATLAASEWQTADRPLPLTVTTASLDNEPQAANGTVTVYALVQPAQVQRASLDGPRRYSARNRATKLEPEFDAANADSWALGEQVATHSFNTDATGQAVVTVPLPAGIYRVSLTTQDRFGKTVTARQTLTVVDPRAKKYSVKLANRFTAPTWSVEPGEKFTALWGTGYPTGRALVEIMRAGKILKRYWTAVDRTQALIEFPITEEMRGGVSVSVTYLRENRLYTNQRVVDVPWSNKELKLTWERFRSKLLPGAKETWTAVITGPDAKRATAEIVATLYDASLDQFSPHQWPEIFNVFRSENSFSMIQFQNAVREFQYLEGQWAQTERVVNWSYRKFPDEILSSTNERIQLDAFSVRSGYASERFAGAVAPDARMKAATMSFIASDKNLSPRDLADTAPLPPPAPDLSQVSARKNLNETAFFFPQLLADENGVVKLQFTMPEALTEWKFLGFAHDRKLRSGFLTAKAVTAKDLMVEPNPPRFVREGDAIEFTVKVSNQSEQTQRGRVRLSFADAATQASADAALGNEASEQSFDLPAKQSRSFSWRLRVPDGLGFLTYKAVGATNELSDGEEGFLPVLSRRVLVRESLPLPVRGVTTKEFTFPKLLASGQSTTLQNQSLTVQMVSQPAWYAVMALPYLMEYPYECSEQIFSRLYANTLARHIAKSDPKIQRIFELWKNTPALDSPLEKNADLKSVLLEETPWVRQATSESQARKNVGLLFDANRLDSESARALATLAERQLADGRWAWFPGGAASDFITLYITTGFGRLRHLGAPVDIAPALKSIDALDAWMTQRYRDIRKAEKPEDYIPSSTDALYLYGRSFFLKERPIASAHREAIDFFRAQADKHWTAIDSRQSLAHLAIALQRFGSSPAPQAIMKSLKERSLTSEELGMFWRDDDRNWWWDRAPIETQAMMIEAFDEIAHDTAAVEACQVWLLKQKQTQGWATTKATADAVYALLLRGGNLLASDAPVEVTLGNTLIKPEKVEAGTGFYEKKFVRDEIKPAMGQITVKKTDGGVSWGSVHWQYLEDIAKITPHTGTPLTLTKTLFVKETSKGQVLRPVNGPLAVGDELIVRIELRTDRDMEFVHLKDQRGSGTEPVNVLSGYRYQDGLGYYESTRDTASHFFIDRLPKGTYVFEYATRVQLRGTYQSGIAEIQCMYAPEFNSHSASVAIEVK